MIDPKSASYQLLYVSEENKLSEIPIMLEDLVIV